MLIGPHASAEEVQLFARRLKADHGNFIWRNAYPLAFSTVAASLE